MNVVASFQRTNLTKCQKQKHGSKKKIVLKLQTQLHCIRIYRIASRVLNIPHKFCYSSEHASGSFATFSFSRRVLEVEPLVQSVSSVSDVLPR